MFVPPKPLTERLTVVSFKSTTSPQDAKTTQLVKTLRNNVLPSVYTGHAESRLCLRPDRDLRRLRQRAFEQDAAVHRAVVGLSFLLLMIAFRSLLIPLTAAVMNLFAAGGVLRH